MGLQMLAEATIGYVGSDLLHVSEELALVSLEEITR
jgi:hypothetical protein